MRGSASMDSAVTFFAASCCIRSGFWAGQMKPISVWPARISATSSGVGGRTLNTMSLPFHRSAALGAMLAPASR